MDKITTTLNAIKECSPCTDGYQKLVKGLGGLTTYGKDTPITFKQIYDINGYDDMMWCLRTVDPKYYPLWRHFAVDAAMAVEHLMEDARSKQALVVARLHADGKATDEELAAARDAARDAAWDAAWDAARAAAWDAARDAAWDAAWDAARAAAWDAQVELLFEYCRLGERPADSEKILQAAFKAKMEYISKKAA